MTGDVSVGGGRGGAGAGNVLLSSSPWSTLLNPWIRSLRSPATSIDSCSGWRTGRWLREGWLCVSWPLLTRCPVRLQQCETRQWKALHPCRNHVSGCSWKIVWLWEVVGHNSRRRASRAMDLKSRDWSLVATKIEEIEYTCGC